LGHRALEGARAGYQGPLALLEEIRPALAAVVETMLTLRTARGLFSIYLGRNVGERVLNGQIPAVNLAFRLEALTKGLGRPVLASCAFAAASGPPLVSLGAHPIRGFRGLEEVFGLPSRAQHRSVRENPRAISGQERCAMSAAGHLPPTVVPASRSPGDW
jgi:hypothetical protein